MASWEDGPEYAPRQRPAAFVTPQADPLAVIPPPAAIVAPTVPGPPVFAGPEANQPELAALVPASPSTRDPNEPFAVATAALSSWSADRPPGTGRDPAEPFAGPGPSLSGYFPVVPSVQPNAVLNPPPLAPPEATALMGQAPLSPISQWAEPAPVETGPSAVVGGMTVGVIIPLIVGILFSPLSALMLALAFFLSVRIQAPRAHIRTVYLGAVFVMAIVAMLALPAYQATPSDIWDAVNTGARWACVLLLPALYAIVSFAVRAQAQSGRRP